MERKNLDQPDKCLGQLPCRCSGSTCLGGGGISEGNVYVNGFLVCNHCWDGIQNGMDYQECENWQNDRNAMVVCKQLGFENGKVGNSGR